MPSRNVTLTAKEQECLLEHIPTTNPLHRKIANLGKTIKVSSRKAKGRDLQYWVCEEVARLLGLEFAQGDDQCLIHSREMGQHGKDIILRGEAHKRFPFSIECKNTETLPLPEVIRQAKENTGDDEDWLVVHKRKAIKDPIVIMDWNTFASMWREP